MAVNDGNAVRKLTYTENVDVVKKVAAPHVVGIVIPFSSEIEAVVFGLPHGASISAASTVSNPLRRGLRQLLRRDA